MDCFYMSSKNLSKKPKKTWVFLVFCLTSSKSSFKKPKKPWVSLVFSRSWPKKTKKLRENQKKQKRASDQTFSEKFCFFGFLEVSSHTSLFLFGRNSGSKINPTGRDGAKQMQQLRCMGPWSMQVPGSSSLAFYWSCLFVCSFSMLQGLSEIALWRFWMGSVFHGFLITVNISAI